ncbi:MBL fold metallo-hydrolase [Marinivivus vitaminiproducens]|uniref:MBL fold metallo-hydrolase n=1 Tax=Marinivivus vitaminiproducens TaxID=3035935 RepID=UPI0027AACE88|nr:MBL fold metallo-hydrolase [Geminicoccaceae bacterium SCSIO 64248]
MEGYEIFAIRYASNATRRSSQNFLRGDPHDSPMPMDFFVWALRSNERTIVVDTGFSEQRGREEGFPVSRPVALSLKQIGIESEPVDTVVLTHMH